MTESGWLSLATAIISAISAGFVLFLNFKYGKLADKTEHVIKQNETQQDTISQVKDNVGTMKREIDGRLTEYRRLVEQKALVDVAAALIEGRKQGEELERLKGESKAKAVLAVAAAAEKEEEKK